MNGNVIHTSDLKMKKVLDIAESVAASKATVLIQGESGTGKELLARYIHAKSSRANKRFFAINCAAVPENLLESELFGYEKGAFTGADSRRLGKFEQASGSTFLLDEISELPLQLQSKLLRVIQEGEIERLGGKLPVAIDVRLIAATNCRMEDLVKAGRFREDLFYRLNVIPLTIPPLRERGRDIGLLARLFVEMSCAENGLPLRQFSPEAERKLNSWNWPGNVRELQNVIERTVLLTKGSTIDENEVLIENYQPATRDRALQPGMTVDEAERLLIMKTLEFTAQNRTQAAELLGISIRTLRNKINEYKSERL